MDTSRGAIKHTRQWLNGESYRRLPQVGNQHNALGFAFRQQMIDRIQRRLDTRGVLHNVILDGHIVIDAHQDTLAVPVQVLERHLLGQGVGVEHGVVGRVWLTREQRFLGRNEHAFFFFLQLVGRALLGGARGNDLV